MVSSQFLYGFFGNIKYLYYGCFSRQNSRRIVKDLYKVLEYAGTGLNGALGGKPKDEGAGLYQSHVLGRDLWSDVFNERSLSHSEWCGRCNQTYVKAEDNLLRCISIHRQHRSVEYARRGHTILGLLVVIRWKTVRS